MSMESALQQTIYSVLTTALSVDVYDNVPQPNDSGKPADFPYVTIGEDSSIEWDTNTETGSNTSIVIHTWSRTKGRKETKELQGLIYNALHRQTLTVTGYTFICCDWENSSSFVDSDGETRHGVQTFKILIES